MLEQVHKKYNRQFYKFYKFSDTESPKNQFSKNLFFLFYAFCKLLYIALDSMTLKRHVAITANDDIKQCSLLCLRFGAHEKRKKFPPRHSPGDDDLMMMTMGMKRTDGDENDDDDNGNNDDDDDYDDAADDMITTMMTMMTTTAFLGIC